MAHPGQTLENALTGERIVFRKTAKDTGGELLEVDFFWPPGFDRRVPHIHPKMEERFQVLSGTARFRLGSREVMAGPGQIVTVPTGVAHISSNAGTETVHVRVQFRPALRQEAFLESLYALAPKGTGTGSDAQLGILQRALLAHAYSSEVRPVRPPILVQRILFPILATMARLCGHTLYS